MLKTPLLSALFLIYSLLAFANDKPELDKEDVLSTVEELISERQYESAFYLLDAFDPENEKLDFVLKKAEIAFEYYTKALQHRYFIFSNLEKGEELEDLRAEDMEGDYSVFSFPYDEVLEDWALRVSDVGEIHKWLGLFYHFVFGMYGDEWIIPADDVLLRAAHHFTIHAGQSPAPYTHSRELAFVKFMSADFTESIYWLEDARTLFPEEGDVWYNLAAAYFYLLDYDSVIPFAEKAIQVHTDPYSKVDAYRLIGITFLETDRPRDALIQFTIADELTPENYLVHLSLLDTYLALERNRRARRMAIHIFDNAPANPGVMGEVLVTFFEHETYRPLKRLFNRSKRKYIKDDEVLGNIYFHEGRMFLHLEDRQTAKEKFLKAKDYFENSVEEYHYVFDVIEETLRQIRVLEETQ